MVTVQIVPADVTFPLRQAVLRPHQTVEDLAREEDAAPESATFAACDEAGDVVATGTVSRRPPPWWSESLASEPSSSATADAAPAGSDDKGWQVRGMAADPQVRGRSLGSAVLGAILEHVAAHGGGLLWCNARVPAQRFYERSGLTAIGDVFDVEHIGPHIRMWRRVAAAPGDAPAADRSSAPPA